MNLPRNNLLRTAFDAYLLQLDGGELEPAENYLSYDFDGIDSYQWQGLADQMVKDELREITNNLNHWHGSLRRWQAWNTIIQPYGTNEAWELRREFWLARAIETILKATPRTQAKNQDI